MTVKLIIYCDHCSVEIMHMDALTLSTGLKFGKELRMKAHICEECEELVGDGYEPAALRMAWMALKANGPIKNGVFDDR